MTSQNTLHLGWGTTNPTRPFPPAGLEKFAAFQAEVVASQITAFQEVMAPNNTAPFGCAGVCRFAISPNAYGAGRYFEYYLFAITDATVTVPGAVIECNVALSATCANFSRPPASLPFQIAGAQPAVMLNLHAIWGRTVAGREAEAASIPTIVTAIMNRIGSAQAQVIVGADWNLTAAQVEAQVCAATAPCVLPTGNTTLTRAGAPSSSYDHFLWIPKAGAKPAPAVAPAVRNWAPQPSSASWRTTVSDHLGVTGTFTIP